MSTRNPRRSARGGAGDPVNCREIDLRPRPALEGHAGVAEVDFQGRVRRRSGDVHEAAGLEADIDLEEAGVPHFDQMDGERVQQFVREHDAVDAARHLFA